jgi:hypothetical protein
MRMFMHREIIQKIIRIKLKLNHIINRGGNKRVLVLFPYLMFLSSCKTYVSSSLRCNNEVIISKIKNHNLLHKGNKLIILEDVFNESKCIGLVKYEYNSVTKSCGIYKLALITPDGVIFASKNKKNNEFLIDDFINKYSEYFSEEEINDLKNSFKNGCVIHGNF